ncbi:class I SAM-dependent methyltransferase [Kangiella japonica]|uniref:Class I SAM-dependent methyltransferase n=1 Tax=Kangiella japonica TaxID=647384 RepID=A0ABN0ST37_9GAMM
MRVLTASAIVLAMSTLGCTDASEQAKNETTVKDEVKTEVKTEIVKSSNTETTESSEIESLWNSILNSEHRSDKNKQRDQYRHPQETLSFFGIEPGMTVVEIAPGGGWYTEILSPLLGKEGKLYAAHYDPSSTVEYYRNSREKFSNKIASDADLYANVEITIFQPPELFDMAAENSADAVVTFRNVHNWLRGGREATVDSFKAMYDVLKPGGVLGVVEHRLPKDMKQDEKASSGYMHQDFVISVAQEAGFKLVATSEINANPKDTADHPKGVWSLPPGLRLGDEDREKYMSIGESDRMTLKFVKPAKE